MIKEYQNGIDFLNENLAFLNQNKYMSAFFILDAKLINEISSNNYIIKVEDDNHILLALKLEPYNLLLYGSPLLLKELLNYLDKKTYHHEFIMCSTMIGDLLENEYQYTKSIGMDFMEATIKTMPSCECLKGELSDKELLFKYLCDFIFEVGLSDKLNKDIVEKDLDSFRLIKVNGEIATFGKMSKSTNDDIKIAYVYTVPKYRGLGLAKKLVNAMKNEIIDQGKIATLYVDQKNPISNHLYSSLGFKKVFSQGIYEKNRRVR